MSQQISTSSFRLKWGGLKDPAACGCMYLPVFVELLLVHWMSFWELCCHSLWICPFLCFSGHVICSLAALLFLLLTPLRTLTSCRPLTHIFTFLFLLFLRLVHFLFVLVFFPLKIPTFLSVTDTPSHRLFSAPTGRGEVTLVSSLFLCLSVFVTLVYILFFLCLSFYPCFSSLSFPTFPILLFAFLCPPPACLHGYQTSIALLPLRLHGSTVMMGSSYTSLLEMMLWKNCINAAWPTDLCLCMAWKLRVILLPAHFPSSLIRGKTKKRGYQPFFFWLVSALFMYECYGCFTCRWFYLNSVHFILK